VLFLAGEREAGAPSARMTRIQISVVTPPRDRNTSRLAPPERRAGGV